MPKRTIHYRIDTGSPSLEFDHDPNGTALRPRADEDEDEDTDIEDMQTVAVLTDDEDELAGIPESAAEKIRKSKQALLSIASNLKEREQRIKIAEIWARQQEELRRKANAEQKAKERRGRKGQEGACSASKGGYCGPSLPHHTPEKRRE